MIIKISTLFIISSVSQIVFAYEYPIIQNNDRNQVDQSKIELLESRLSLLTEDVARLGKYNRCFQCTTSKNQDECNRAKENEGRSVPLAYSKQGGRLLSRRSFNDGQKADFFRGERGEPGRNGLDGLPGLDGAPGLDGIPGVDGRNGKNGINGRDGKDGKDGSPGERGPIGPPGPSGDVGRRGKPGPPGKTGAPGQPGVCAYRAKYDCSLLFNKSETNPLNDDLQALLIAPTMIGREHIDSIEERQVTVNEGDNIQLSCEAFGLPKPAYVWYRVGTKSTILLDIGTDFKVVSFPGSQLPLINVDRLQAGNYECVASNGIPPAAIKKINLDVNYAPTIRLYPSPSIYQVKLGSSFLIECIVEANPESFSYWMFGSNLIMSIASSQPKEEFSSLISKHKKYIITESTGQLSTGAYYSTLTLNITNISADDLGLYKCISKNLIGQSIGYALIVSRKDSSVEVSLEDSKFKDMILEKSLHHGRMDHTVGWPSYLIEREANYSTFGNQHRQFNSSAKKLSELSGSQKISLIETLIYNINETAPTILHVDKRKDKSNLDQTNASVTTNKEHRVEGESASQYSEVSFSEETDENDLCRIEKIKYHESRYSESRKSGILLLDQVGKPVYVGSVSQGLLNWWSLDSKFRDNTSLNVDYSLSNFYATSTNNTQELFEYESLSDLLKDWQNSNSDQIGTVHRTRRSYKLKHPIIGNTHLIYGGIFLYVSVTINTPKYLENLRVVMLNLKNQEHQYLTLDKKISRDFDNQPLDLGPDFKLNRVEFASDENGVWLILPTVEQQKSKKSGITSSSAQDHMISKTYRLHVLKLILNKSEVDSSIEIEYHVSMKLDWRMIGQMFIIDGVLYGIKDRHLYSSKLQFAYDLYKCKLLSTEYHNEPHRTFTNHFGNTQMIKYNSNEPKRLYTIDNGNLLWCPVKLIMTNPDDIWQQQQQLKQDNNQTFPNQMKL